MDIKSLAVGALLILVGLGAGFALDRKEAEPAVGGVASPDQSIGGVRLFSGAMTPNLATTTVCAIQSPSSTSTLLAGSIRLDSSSTTASVVTIARSATPYGTTTNVLGVGSVGANAKGVVHTSASSTAGLDSNLVFPPNSYLVVGMAGGSGTFSPTGNCQALWVVN